MKKIATILTAIILASASANAMACPKGTTLVGGTGPNHKGGKCVKKADAPKKASKKADKKADKATKQKKEKSASMAKTSPESMANHGH